MEIICENLTEDLKKELDDLYTKEEWQSKFLVLFGFNAPSEIEYEYFSGRGIKVEAFIDNDVNKVGETYKGCPICFPEDILKYKKENVLVILASSANDAMRKQLYSMGYTDENIYMLRTFDIKRVEPFEKDARYTYQEMSLREIQLAALEILKYVRDFCDKENIRYYLSYGSLLGAVRHKGFIPWDDDIDIIMPWKDYVRFCKIFPDNKKYRLVSCLRKKSDKEICSHTITKIMDEDTVTDVLHFPIHTRQAVCIDIFPMNGYPDNEEERKLYDIELKKLDVKWGREVLRKIGTNQLIHEKMWELWSELENAMTRYDYDNSEYVGSVSCTPFNHSIAPKSKYDSPSIVVFEGEQFKAANDVDYILRETYGDYMKLPPEEQRVSRHFYKTYKVQKNRSI